MSEERYNSASSSYFNPETWGYYGRPWLNPDVLQAQMVINRIHNAMLDIIEYLDWEGYRYRWEWAMEAARPEEGLCVGEGK